MNQRFLNKLTVLWANFLAKVSDFYPVTFYVERREELFDRFDVKKDIHDDVGIILQGPVLKKDSFTLNTVAALKDSYPNVQLILSTWDDEGTDEFNDLNITVVKSPKPSFFGLGNINLQLASTQAGLQSLDKRAIYVLKMRTDQRFDTDRDFIAYFKNLMSLFPVAKDICVSSRMIAQGLQFHPAVKYPVSDFFMFGSREDVSLYWDIPHDNKKEPAFIDVTQDNFMKAQVSEGYLLHHFFETVAYEPEWSWECSEKFMTDYFCIIDQHAIGKFWYKYHWPFGNRRKRKGNLLKDDSLGFMEWFQMYMRNKG